MKVAKNGVNLKDEAKEGGEKRRKMNTETRRTQRYTEDDFWDTQKRGLRSTSPKGYFTLVLHPPVNYTVNAILKGWNIEIDQ